ncbi:tetratricopeptide repeat protein [Persicitalea jodogahamensis]|uniref:Tetratricopeptide repeat protein n=1 Tax=Persicitalea jodogahamensis TaxID=402147 RepID=A0A8J3D0U7_9BACT|nr:tetratricopeptide repeat protein [Persicitalea jodogahamensis]GHB51994.1 hypothetical protein GCM10007390_00740 [Persicitalea jodogahamensis]
MNDHIEDYFNQDLPPPEKAKFEEDLRQNPQLQEEVAFYLKTKQVLREQTLAERHAEWQKSAPAKTPVRRIPIWQYAAAAVVVLAMGWAWLWLSGTKELTEPRLAQAYVEQELDSLSVQMSGAADSLELAKDQYNKSKYDDALTIGNDLLRHNPNNGEALKVAGLAALRQQDYDLAIEYFHRLAGQPDLFYNPGKFYEAIAYLYRNRPSDKKKAKDLLEDVATSDQVGKAEKEQARQWLAELEGQ